MTAKIYYAEIWGTRSQKYKTLLTTSAVPNDSASCISDTNWTELAPNPPFYLFMPQEQAFREEYEEGWKATDIFPVNVLGFQTHRDQFAIDFNETEIAARIMVFGDNSVSDQEVREKFQLGGWNFSKVRSALSSDKLWRSGIVKCLYRPFDERYWYFSKGVTDRPRTEIVRNVIDRKNLIMLLSRQQAAIGFHHVFVTDLPPNDCVMSTTTREANQVFPLWRYPTTSEAAMGMEREPNIAPAFLTALKERVPNDLTPEAIFHYAYAVFHAPTYRARYAAFLKTDFPRLPLPPDSETFHTLAALGATLVALHLLEAPALQKHGIGYPVSGDHTVAKFKADKRYTAPPAPNSGGAGEDGLTPPNLGAGGPLKGRVWLNATEYFDSVPPEAWGFRVGGYQPAFKWLDDRAGRKLTEGDITHYRRMIAALRETASLLPAVDAAFQALLDAAEPTEEYPAS